RTLEQLTIAEWEAFDEYVAPTTIFDFEYSGGVYDVAERKFRGFKRIVERNPDQSVKTTWFHQDEYLQGKAFYARFQSASGDDSVEESFDWNKTTVSSSESGFIHLDVHHTEIIENNQPTAFIDRKYTYDYGHGLKLQSIYSGTGAEDATITYEFDNAGDWMWRLSRRTLAGSNSGMMRKTDFTYDSHGNLARVSRWQEGKHPVETQYKYDVFGNKSRYIDERGYTTKFELDYPLRTFLRRRTGPVTWDNKSHVVEFSDFDYRCGRPRKSKDERGFTTSFIHDAIGRILRVEYPGGGRKTVQYDYSEFPYKVITKIKETDNSEVESVAWFDGLNRQTQIMTYGEN
ncbi:MAG: hypothetical protein GY866_04965, partial [Proteobacteria bacterium]|nr:hypothetical protein [Pseudomonadota bacterium]